MREHKPLVAHHARGFVLMNNFALIKGLLSLCSCAHGSLCSLTPESLCSQGVRACAHRLYIESYASRVAPLSIVMSQQQKHGTVEGRINGQA